MREKKKRRRGEEEKRKGGNKRKEVRRKGKREKVGAKNKMYQLWVHPVQWVKSEIGSKVSSSVKIVVLSILCSHKNLR